MMLVVALSAIVGVAFLVVAIGALDEWAWRRSPLGQASLALARAEQRRMRPRLRSAARLRMWHALQWLILASAALAAATWSLGPLIIELVR